MYFQRVTSFMDEPGSKKSKRIIILAVISLMSQSSIVNITNIFMRIFFSKKISNPNCKLRKSAQNTFVLKASSKMLVKLTPSHSDWGSIICDLVIEKFQPEYFSSIGIRLNYCDTICDANSSPPTCLPVIQPAVVFRPISVIQVRLTGVHRLLWRGLPLRSTP